MKRVLVWFASSMVAGLVTVPPVLNLRPTADAFTLGEDADPDNAAGQTLTVENESVSFTFVSSSGAFNNEFVGDPLAPETSFYCHNVRPGTEVAGGDYTAEEEIVFSLKTPDGDEWLSGPGERSRDGFNHARLTPIDASTVLLEWEDLPNGGDVDFDDCVVEIRITPRS